MKILVMRLRSSSFIQAILLVFIVQCAFITWWWSRPTLLLCRRDFSNNGRMVCRPKCKHGFYSLPSMHICEPWLGCDKIESEEFQVQHPRISTGAVKNVSTATWRGHRVAFSKLKKKKYLLALHSGLSLLTEMQPNPQVTQLIGFCHHTYVTEYHELGSAKHINGVMRRPELHAYNTVSARLRLCQSYVSVLAIFHDDGRVMCDSNFVGKTLSQYLITSDLQLVVNDLDAVPRAPLKTPSMCGEFQVYGDLIAPEHKVLLVNPARIFNDSFPPVGMKSDIWKIPDICEEILGDYGARKLKVHLSPIHARCKLDRPELRPTAREVLSQYTEILYNWTLTYNSI